MSTATKPFYLVSGFHRSGTSLLAHTLMQNGVHMGDELMGASFANRQGHAEDHSLVQIHDQMLAANGYDWRCTGIQLSVPAFLQDKLNRYVASRNHEDTPYIGVKDPRAVHFSEAWQQATDNQVKAIFVYRDWRYCLSSLLKRHSRELLHYTCPMQQRELDFAFWQQPELAAQLWLASSRATLQWMDRAPESTLFVPLSALINQDRSLFSEAGKKGIPKKLFQLTHSFERSLLQSVIPESLLHMIPTELQQECESIQSNLNTRSGINTLPEDIAFSKTHHLSRPGNDHRPSSSLSEKTAMTLDGLSVNEALEVLHGLPANKLEAFPWEALMALPVEDAKVWETIYKAALRYNKPQIAEAAITRALTLQPMPWRMMYLGDLYLAQKQLSLAKQCYLTARKMTPDNATFLARLADVATEQGRHREAQSLIDNALQLDATKPAIQSAQKRLSIASASADDREVPTSSSHPFEMPKITGYMDVVRELTNAPERGEALDDYFVRYMFIRRNNPIWLATALKSLTSAQGQCLQDYLFGHLTRYWPDKVLETEMYESPSPYLGLPAPSADQQVSRNAAIGVHLHVYYRHLVPEVMAFLSNMPHSFRLVVTCSESDQSFLAEALPSASEIVPVENRGRDIAPWLMHASPRLDDCELVLKVHTKSTPHATELAGWRLQLLWALLGSQQHIQYIISTFTTPETGILLPPYHPAIIKDVHWGSNVNQSKEIAKRMGIDLPEKIEMFPAGSMFWYRPGALLPLTKYHWRLSDFPEESGQTDGTIMHAIERLVCLVVNKAGMQSRFISML